MSVDIPCKCPLPPNNGFTSTCSGYVSTGYKLSYHCSNTHKLVGVQSRTCQGNGIWTGRHPSCVRGRAWHELELKLLKLLTKTTLMNTFSPTGCPCPSAPVNGYTSFCSVYRPYSTYYWRSYYYCNSGYSLNGGSSHRICQSDFTWSGSAPICVKST